MTFSIVADSLHLPVQVLYVVGFFLFTHIIYKWGYKDPTIISHPVD